MSSPQSGGDAPAVPAPGIVPVSTVTHSRHAEQSNRRSHSLFEEEMARAGPHRCASRLDDFVVGIYNFKFDTAGSRWSLFRKCMNNPGSEQQQHRRLPPHSQLTRDDQQPEGYTRWPQHIAPRRSLVADSLLLCPSLPPLAVLVVPLAASTEPRDPHLNLPVARLPRWDPMHPTYDPDAPYDSFRKPLKKTEAEARALLEERRLQREEQWTQMQQQSQQR